VAGGHPETKLKDEKAKYRDGTIPICSILPHGDQHHRPTGVYRALQGRTHLRKREPKSRSENDTEKSQPAEAQLNVPWKPMERSRDERTPDSSNGFAHDGGGDKSERDDSGKRENVTGPIQPAVHTKVFFFCLTHRIKVQAQKVCTIL
jgi:hypothetical protein